MPIGTRKAKTELVVDPSKLDRGLKEGRSKFGQFASSVGKLLGKGIRGVGSYLAQSLNPLGRGLDVLFGQVDAAREYETGIARLAIAQRKSNGEMDDFREAITKASSETGVARNEILRGVQAYQSITGDTEGATQAMSVFAEVTEATGARVEDVAGAAAALSQNFAIDPKDFKAALGIINTAGKDGSVELKDMAIHLSSLTAGFKRFAGGTGMGALQTATAALQVVQKNFGNDAAQGATGLNAFMTAIVKNAGRLEKAGVKVFSDKGHEHLKDFTAILDAIGNSTVLKDQTKLQKALGRDEAVKAYYALRDYRAQYDQLNSSKEGAASIDADRAQFAQSEAGQLKTAINNLELAAVKAFTPERIEQFAHAVGDAAELMGKLVDAIGAVEEGILSLTGKDQAGNLVSDKLAAKTSKRVDVNNAEALHEFERQVATGGRGAGYSLGRTAGVINEQGRSDRAATTAVVNALPSDQRGPQREGVTPTAMLARQILDVAKRPIFVKLQVDGNTMATGIANAPQAGTHPGG